MQKGKLIVIEGLDGSGKATQVELICKKMQQKNKKVYKLSFPDYNELSSVLVKMYLNGEFGNSLSDVSAYAATSFFAVDRYASYKKFWKNNYKNGETIIADRYTTSNAIYQLCRLPRQMWDSYLTWLEDYEYNKLELPKPDLVIYLDMPIEVSQKLIYNRYNGNEDKKDLYEKNVNFLRKCYEAAKYTSKKLGWENIACSENEKPKPIKEINFMIEEKLRKII